MGLVQNASAVDALAVTPNDSTDLPKGATRWFMVGGAGNIKVTMASGSVVTINGLVTGVEYNWSVKRIWATGTTATNIVALY